MSDLLKILSALNDTDPTALTADQIAETTGLTESRVTTLLEFRPNWWMTSRQRARNPRGSGTCWHHTITYAGRAELINSMAGV